MSLNYVGYLYADFFAISILENSSEICNKLKNCADKLQGLEILKKNVMSWMYQIYVDTSLFYHLLP